MTDATEAIAGLRWARAYNTECHIRPRQIVELLAHIDAQAAEIERLRVDAERYAYAKTLEGQALVIDVFQQDGADALDSEIDKERGK